MLTECPHCFSVLKVSAELIYAGDPRVRCGECLRIFSARDHLTQAESDLDSTKIYQPPKRETASIEEPIFSLSPEVAEGLQAIVDKPRRSATATKQSMTTAPTVERTRRSAIPSRSTDVHSKPEKPAAMASAPAKAKPQPATAGQTKEDSATTDRHISVLARNPTAGRSAPVRTRSVVTFLLIAALVLLAVDALRSVVSNPSISEKIASTWCAFSSCDAVASRDFSGLQIVRRKIYGHPGIDGVLVISLAMINRLDSDLEYPTLQVRMTDQNGEVIARGVFEPSHYVPSYTEGMSIEPERVVDVVLQVEDPGEAAQSFDLEFL